MLSIILLFPEPLGPATVVKPCKNGIVTLFAKDLKWSISNDFIYICLLNFHLNKFLQKPSLCLLDNNLLKWSKSLHLCNSIFIKEQDHNHLY